LVGKPRSIADSGTG